MTAPKMTLKKGDQVQIIAGNNKGKTGKLVKVLPKQNLVVVEDVNIRQKKVRGSDGQVTRAPQACPLHRSNVKKIVD